MGKTIKVAEAVAAIPDGATLMIGGFMAVGTPRRLIDELVRQGRKDLTVISNDTARPGVGIGKLISARLIRRVVTNHIGTNPETQHQMLAGELEVELVPQGTLVERIRAGGYGLGGVLTPTGMGTTVEDGKRTVEMGGAMDLVTGARRVIVAMTHTAKGKPKIVDVCSLPLTSSRRVDLIVTELAVIEPGPDGLVLKELAPGVDVAQVQQATAARLIVPARVPSMTFTSKRNDPHRRPSR